MYSLRLQERNRFIPKLKMWLWKKLLTKRKEWATLDFEPFININIISNSLFKCCPTNICFTNNIIESYTHLVHFPSCTVHIKKYIHQSHWHSKASLLELLLRQTQKFKTSRLYYFRIIPKKIGIRILQVLRRMFVKKQVGNRT